MKARKQGEIALKAAEQLREKAQDTAQQLKDSSEQRLVDFYAVNPVCYTGGAR